MCFDQMVHGRVVSLRERCPLIRDVVKGRDQPNNINCSCLIIIIQECIYKYRSTPHFIEGSLHIYIYIYLYS